MIAVNNWILTAFIDLPRNFLSLRFCFIHLKNNSISHRTLELKLQNLDVPVSPNKIRDALNSMQFAEVEIQDEKFLIKTKSEELASKILRQLKIQPPKNIVAVADFIAWF